jgi:hypothetical protein
MPSVKSYQSRKKEVSVLQARVRILEYQLDQERKNSQTAERLHQVTIQTQSQFLNALSIANDELECRIRVYRDYIRNGEGCALPPLGWICTRMPGHDGPCATVNIVTTSQTINIPACLKPLDVLEYIRKKIENGPDNLSQ